MRCCFESGGWARLYREHCACVRQELAEDHAAELESARWWRRWKIARRQRAEIERVARARMPSDDASASCD